MITFLTGDATFPEGDGPKLIAHIVNDRGGWGHGFVVAISKRWKAPEKQYRDWADSPGFYSRGPSPPLAGQAHPAFQAGPPRLPAVRRDDLSPAALPGGSLRSSLGLVQFVKVEPDITVANMLAQHGYKTRKNPHPVQIGALGNCLERVSAFATQNKMTVHMPRIACGLGGLRWSDVEPVIERSVRVPVRGS
jgi:hypothetical protein